MPENMRGQAGVEYLFVIVFIVGFIVSAVVPAVKEAEISLAMASARTAIINFQAENPAYIVSTLNYSQQQDTVIIRPIVHWRVNGSEQPPPATLKSKIVSAIHNSVGREANASCVFAANYAYCLYGA